MVSVSEQQHATLPYTWMEAGLLRDTWQQACDGLSAAHDAEGGPSEPFDVSIALVGDAERGMRTRYSVRGDVSLAPRCSITRRVAGRSGPQLGTGDARFESVASVETDDVSAVSAFLTHERRQAIVQLLTELPMARVTNKYVSALSTGVDQDATKVAGTMDLLLAVAEVMRPSWVNVALDERSVLHDLFGMERDLDGISRRFEALYLGNSVSWIGEVLEVGATDGVGKRVAVLIGSADGRTPDSGRVVALTALDANADVEKGDVVAIDGSLWNLDPKKRFLRID